MLIKNSEMIVFLKQNTLGEVRRKLLKVFYALPQKRFITIYWNMLMLKKFFKKTKNFNIINKNSDNKFTNTASYWSQMQTKKRPKLSWLELPEIEAYVNNRVSGNPKGIGFHL